MASSNRFTSTTTTTTTTTNFEIQADHLISARQPDLVIITKIDE